MNFYTFGFNNDSINVIKNKQNFLKKKIFCFRKKNFFLFVKKLQKFYRKYLYFRKGKILIELIKNLNKGIEKI